MLISQTEEFLLWALFLITCGSISAIAILLIRKNLGRDVDEERTGKANWKNFLVLLSYLPVVLGAATVRFYEKFWISMAFAVIGGTLVYLIFIQALKKDFKEHSEMGKAYEVLSTITIAFRFTLTYVLFVLLFFGFDIKRVMSIITSSPRQ